VAGRNALVGCRGAGRGKACISHVSVGDPKPPGYHFCTLGKTAARNLHPKELAMCPRAGPNVDLQKTIRKTGKVPVQRIMTKVPPGNQNDIVKKLYNTRSVLGDRRGRSYMGALGRLKGDTF